jgi:hypothetical protein
MSSSVVTRNAVRRERTVSELRRLSDAMGAWLKHRRDADHDVNGRYIGRHKTQLDTIERVLKRAAEQLAKDADALSTDGDAGAFADDCRAIDIATVWLQRLWEFYRERFDQRDDEDLGPVLQAADEIIWSCYHEVMQHRSAADRGAAPLAIIASQYSPSALESDQPLRGDLRLTVDFADWDEDLKTLVSALPLPLIALPPWCVRAPWWLIYLAHEVGHHVQDKLNLIAHFREGIGRTAASGGQDAAAWSAWSGEIFADVFSVLAVGRWAAWSVAEVERSTPDKMNATRSKYPSPALRLLLLQSTAKCVGLDAPEAVADLDLQAANVQKQSEVADAVARFAVGPAPDGRPLPEVLGLAARREPGKRTFEERVAFWRGGLRAAAASAPAATLPTARQVIAGATAAWYDVSRIADAKQRLDASEALRQATVTALRASGPEGTRGDKQAEAPDVGELFAIGLRRCGKQVSVR